MADHSKYYQSTHLWTLHNHRLCKKKYLNIKCSPALSQTLASIKKHCTRSRTLHQSVLVKITIFLSYSVIPRSLSGSSSDTEQSHLLILCNNGGRSSCTRFPSSAEEERNDPHCPLDRDRLLSWSRLRGVTPRMFGGFSDVR